MVLRETLRKAVLLFPKKQGIVCGQKRFTYEEFGNRGHRFALGLTGLGLRKESKVALLHRNCHCFLEAYYGTAEIGAGDHSILQRPGLALQGAEIDRLHGRPSENRIGEDSQEEPERQVLDGLRETSPLTTLLLIWLFTRKRRSAS